MNKPDKEAEAKARKEQATNAEKAGFFDELARRFYERNFGTLSKSEIELMMFHFYSEQHKNQPEKLDPYTMSKDLGITQGRVRNLKVKEYLVYPRRIDWQKVFGSTLDGSIKYNEVDNSVEIPVLDPRMFLEIEHEVEVNRGFVRYRANKKILAVPLLDFSKLLVRLDGSLKEKDRNKAKGLIEQAADKEKKLKPEKLRDLLHEVAPSLLASVLGSVFNLGINIITP